MTRYTEYELATPKLNLNDLWKCCLDMASLLPKNGIIVSHSDVAPPPSKDFCQLLVAQNQVGIVNLLLFGIIMNVQVTFRWWKITLRTNAKVNPGETKDSFEDFEYDDRLQSIICFGYAHSFLQNISFFAGEILRVFGRNFLNYIRRIVAGQIDYLPRMPNNLLLRIILQLELEDIIRLSRVSKQFQQVLCYKT